jgi:hypothetical protein
VIAQEKCRKQQPLTTLQVNWTILPSPVKDTTFKEGEGVFGFRKDI